MYIRRYEPHEKYAEFSDELTIRQQDLSSSCGPPLRERSPLSLAPIATRAVEATTLVDISSFSAFRWNRNKLHHIDCGRPQLFRPIAEKDHL
jgi:hypothetical protein